MTHNLEDPGCEVIRSRTYRSMRWRNGRGSTLEIAKEPAGGDPFRWRLSLADVPDDCAFSAYPGYHRALVLVTGKRLRLRFHGHGHRTLDALRRATRFPGEWKTDCTVPHGRCTDLSLIVHRGSASGIPAIVRAPKVLRLNSSHRVRLARDFYGALFVLEGSVQVSGSPRNRPRIVRARDTLLLSPGPERNLALRTRQRSPAQIIVLRWKAAAPGRRTSPHSP